MFWKRKKLFTARSTDNECASTTIKKIRCTNSKLSAWIYTGDDCDGEIHPKTVRKHLHLLLLRGSSRERYPCRGPSGRNRNLWSRRYKKPWVRVVYRARQIPEKSRWLPQFIIGRIPAPPLGYNGITRDVVRDGARNKCTHKRPPLRSLEPGGRTNCTRDRHRRLRFVYVRRRRECVVACNWCYVFFMSKTSPEAERISPGQTSAHKGGDTFSGTSVLRTKRTTVRRRVRVRVWGGGREKITGRLQAEKEYGSGGTTRSRVSGHALDRPARILFRHVTRHGGGSRTCSSTRLCFSRHAGHTTTDAG